MDCKMLLIDKLVYPLNVVKTAIMAGRNTVTKVYSIGFPQSLFYRDFVVEKLVSNKH